jgi:hypothetical protein
VVAPQPHARAADSHKADQRPQWRRGGGAGALCPPNRLLRLPHSIFCPAATAGAIAGNCRGCPRCCQMGRYEGADEALGRRPGAAQLQGLGASPAHWGLGRALLSLMHAAGNEGNTGTKMTACSLHIVPRPFRREQTRLGQAQPLRRSKCRCCAQSPHSLLLCLSFPLSPRRVAGRIDSATLCGIQ